MEVPGRSLCADRRRRCLHSRAQTWTCWATSSFVIIYIKAIWVIDQVGLQVGLRALNDRVRMNFMWKSQLKPLYIKKLNGFRL